MFGDFQGFCVYFWDILSDRHGVRTGPSGSEKDVILISCVRGGQGGIGFLADRQRLNVALTRARKTLIVVGNMETLGRDGLWADFIANAKERNLYKKYSEISNLSSVLKT